MKMLKEPFVHKRGQRAGERHHGRVERHPRRVEQADVFLHAGGRAPGGGVFHFPGVRAGDLPHQCILGDSHQPTRARFNCEAYKYIKCPRFQWNISKLPLIGQTYSIML